MRRLTALFAHPDDETFAIGGTLARYAGDGVRCSLYCATDGDAGRSSGIPVSSRAELAALRRDELRAACDVLGIAALECGGHPDGALAATDPDVVMGEMVRLIRRERPSVVLTFGPEGAPTAHRDHRAISRLATAATLLADTTTAYPEQLADGLAPHRADRLCYVTWSPPAPGSEPGTEGQPIDIRVSVQAWLPRKALAFEAHRSQHQHRARFEQLALLESESYFVAIGVPAPRGAEDLFAGLDPST
ncbi:MAG TPA: PIG-L family deacetylase [Gemmatimonadaceae bacterium]|nr:PIG-L family deacetylase [Gemmatimonadaceae bacterium]